MKWSEYKDVCERSNVFSRWAIDRTCKLLSADLNDQLAQIVRSDAIPKPLDHKGDFRTDMFEVDLDLATQRAIVTQLRQRAADKSESEASSSRISPLIKAWQELLDETQGT